MELQNKNRSVVKNIILLLVTAVAAAGIIAALRQYDQKKEFMEEARKMQAAQEKYMLETFNRIEANLASIREHEGLIHHNLTQVESGGEKDPQERIQNEINIIGQLLDENNALIASLNEQLDVKDKRISAYQRTEKDLRKKLDEYQAEVARLVAEKEKIQQDLNEVILVREQLVVRVNELDQDLAERSATIEKQNQQLVEKEMMLHTAYYTIGTYRSLRDRKILEKEGGFLGINQVKILSNELDPGQFHRIDTRVVTEIPVDARHCEIITDQDPSSYQLIDHQGRVEAIRITDPLKFWEKTRYLVIVVRDNNSELADAR
jgi:DNA repair exonuclease SbcCD ATPase subunit